jgi:hypothetical protein
MRRCARLRRTSFPKNARVRLTVDGASKRAVLPLQADSGVSHHDVEEACLPLCVPERGDCRDAFFVIQPGIQTSPRTI